MEFLLPLLAKMAITAVVIVTASVAAERAGPLVGAAIVSLPISAGPGYVFLAFRASDQFIAESALYTLTGNAAGVCFVTGVALLAPRHSVVPTILAPTLLWLLLAAAFRQFDLDWWQAIAINAAAIIGSFAILKSRPLHFQSSGRKVGPRDLMYRALLSGGLIAAVVTVSDAIGPVATGLAIIYPVALTTLALIIYLRHGGGSAAAVMAQTPKSLIGFGGFALTLHLLAEPVGAVLALLAGLAVSIAWALWMARGVWWRRPPSAGDA
ncbi:MAG: hypothetical protein ACREEE_00255 [Dongiaceae bacterium]